MLKRIRSLLSGPLPTIEQIDKSSNEIDLTALAAAVDAAQQKRASILIDGTVDEILAAERAVDTARIELERGEVALAELARRRDEAEAKAKREDLERRRADAQQLVDEAVTRIEAEYPKHAAAIAELVELARKADAAAGEWFSALVEGQADGLPSVDPVAKRLGWHDKYFNPPLFEDAAVLPPVAGFDGANLRWHTKLEMWAVHGAGAPPQQAA